MSHTHSIIYYRRYDMLATDSVGKFIVGMSLGRYMSYDSYLSTHILYNVATCFGQLYGHPLATRAHQTKTTTAAFILGHNEVSVC
jgi:hypothetical protein